jgi:LysM repeat protein
MNVKRVIVVVLVAVMLLLSFNLTAVQAAPAQQMPMPGQYYVVRPGDTMYSIANRFGTTVWVIARANGIANPSRIYSGQVLFVPAVGPMPPFPPGPQPPLPQCPPGPRPPCPPGPQPPMPPQQPIGGGYVVHVVRYGENLYGIARLYGVSAWSIARANGLANPNYIYVGQSLVIAMRGPRPGPMPGPVYSPGYPGQWGGTSGYPAQYPFPGGTPYGMAVTF